MGVEFHGGLCWEMKGKLEKSCSLQKSQKWSVDLKEMIPWPGWSLGWWNKGSDRCSDVYMVGHRVRSALISDKMHGRDGWLDGWLTDGNPEKSRLGQLPGCVTSSSNTEKDAGQRSSMADTRANWGVLSVLFPGPVLSPTQEESRYSETPS